MFDLDITIIKSIYNACNNLGNIFSLGVFEGAVIYVGAIILGITTIKNKKR